MANSNPTGSSSGNPKPAATLPPGIEIFKPGRAIDDTGAEFNFSPADLAGMVSAYEPAQREAPLTIGHPAHDLPAYGWVAGLGLSADGRLVMTPRQVEPQFAEMVQAGRFPKRSAAFYPPAHPNNPKPGHWYLRHVAFLGAQPPAIAGLKDTQFADAGTSLVCFSEATPKDESDMSKELQDQLAASEAARKTAEDAAAAAAKTADEANEKLAKFAEGQRKATHAAHVQFAEGAMKDGKLKKPDVAAAVAVLDLAAASATVQFSEGDATKTVSPVEFIKGLINAAKPLVQFSEHSPVPVPGGHGGHGMTDAELDTKAKAYALQHNVNYADALGKVASFTTTV